MHEMVLYRLQYPNKKVGIIFAPLKALSNNSLIFPLLYPYINFTIDIYSKQSILLNILHSYNKIKCSRKFLLHFIFYNVYLFLPKINIDITDNNAPSKAKLPFDESPV